MEKREDSSVKVYLNGLGLGSIAAAMYLIQKADFNPSNIHIFEQKGDKDLVGGSCDASEMIVNDQPAYFMLILMLAQSSPYSFLSGASVDLEEVLKRVKKGATPEMMVEASRKVKEAGIPFSVIFILGLGGKELSEVHSRETAKVLSLMDPEYAAALTLMVDAGAPIESDIRSGNLTLLAPEEALKELRDIVDGLRLTDCLFRANHASNYHPIGGRLPGEKELILHQIDDAIVTSSYRTQEVETWNNSLRVLLGLESREPSKDSYPKAIYESGETVNLGDKVRFKSWFFFWKGWMDGTVKYVPGISPRKLEHEYNGLKWVSSNGSQMIVSTLVDPKTGVLKGIKFIERATVRT